MKAIALILFTLAIAASSCGPQQRKGSNEKSGSDDKLTFQLVEEWRTDTLLKIPESVLYDPEEQVLYISCIANRDNPDRAGYISKVNLQGRIVDMKWVTGLTFPKGMTRVGDRVYVAELNTIVEIDVKTAAILQRIAIDSAIFLNDLTSDSEGTIYVSDTRGNDIYSIDNGVVSMLLPDINESPNGLLAEKERLLMTSQGKELLLSMDYRNKKLTTLADSISRGDGIAYAGIPDHYLVSSWTGQVFMVYPDKSKVSLLYTADKNIQTADIAFATDLNLLFVPTFFGNNVVAYKLVHQ